MSIATWRVRTCAQLAAAVFFLLSSTAIVTAQPPSPPPPLWDTQVGAAFVGTSGNTETSTFGADFLVNRRWPVWRLAGAAGAVRASDDGEPTAERYSATLRSDRVLTSFLSLTAGEKGERDELAGIALRNIADGGLSWALIRQPRWTLDGLTSMAWIYENQIGGPKTNSPAGVFQLLSKVPFAAGADTTQRFTYYPNFDVAVAYRSEAEITAQAAMNNLFALKFGFLWRYSNQPVFGFEKTDTTTTASIVVGWRSPTPAP